MNILPINVNQNRQQSFGMNIKYEGYYHTDLAKIKSIVGTTIRNFSPSEQKQLMTAIDGAQASTSDVLVHLPSSNSGLDYNRSVSLQERTASGNTPYPINIGKISECKEGAGPSEGIPGSIIDSLKGFFARLRESESLSEPLTKGESDLEKPYENELLKLFAIG